MNWDNLMKKIYEKESAYKDGQLVKTGEEIMTDDSCVRRSCEKINDGIRRVENIVKEPSLKLHGKNEVEYIKRDSFVDKKIENKVPLYKWSAMFYDGIVNYDIYSVDNVLVAVGTRKDDEKSFEVLKVKSKKAFVNEIEKSSSFLHWEEKLKIKKQN